VWIGGIVLQTLGMAGLASLTGFWPIALGSVLMGVGGGLVSPIFLVYFTEQVPEAVRGRVLGLFNALALVAAPVGLGAVAVVLTVAPLSTAALLVLAVWVLVAGYSLVSRGVRAFVAAPAPTGPAESRIESGVPGESAAHPDH
jgi:MFS family permease